MRPAAVIWLSLGLCLVVMGLVLGDTTEWEVVKSWEFDSQADIAGWVASGEVTEMAVEEGLLKLTTSGSDPIITLPDFELITAPFQKVELRARVRPGGGMLQFFYAADHGGQWNGFSEQQSHHLDFAKDDAWHIYSFFPLWEALPRIIDFRLDPPGGEQQLEIDYIRVIEPVLDMAKAETPDWDLTRPEDAGQWVAQEGVASLDTGPEGLTITASDRWSLTSAYVADVPLEEYGYLYYEGSSTAGEDTEAIIRAVGASPTSVWFPVNSDGQVHRMNLPISLKGRLRMIGLRTPPGAGNSLTLKRLALVKEPQGPVDLWIRYFGRDDGVNRTGKPAKLIAVIENMTGEVSPNATVTLECGPGLRFAPGQEATLQTGVMGYSDRYEAVWEVIADEPGAYEASINLQWAGGSGRAMTTTEFTPVPAVSGDYVPKPVPLVTPYEVGIYYFPGWWDAQRWRPIKEWFRKPLLGYYAEGDPEVMDWQIKWAVERGATFWLFDWYWSQGHRSLEQGLHDAFFNAKYQDMMKFSLLWANHNAPGTSSYEDLMNVCDYWIENYFRRDNYLRIDGKPAVWIFTPYRFLADMGEAEVRRAFDDMKAKCKAAGLNGLYLIGCGHPHTGWAESLRRQGYDAGSEYNAPSIGGQGQRTPYAGLVEAYKDVFQRVADDPTALPFIPEVLCDWDNRAWAGYNALVLHDYTPELLQEHLEDALDAVTRLNIGPAGKPMIIAEAWNEWGEGSICEPSREFGFKMLNAFQKALAPGTPPAPEIIPQDMGRPLKEVTFDIRSAWDFEDGNQGWNMNERIDPLDQPGFLAGRTNGPDPICYGGACFVSAAQFSGLTIRMAASGGADEDYLELFFTSTAVPSARQEASKRVALIKDGQQHDYYFDMRGVMGWEGKITSLRIDAVEGPGVTFYIDSIRFVEALPEG